MTPPSLILAFGLALAPVASHQGEDTTPQGSQVLSEETADPVVSLEERSLATLAALRDSRESKLEELQALRDAYDPNVSSEERLIQLDEVRELQVELRKLEYDFESVATGIDVRAFDLGVEEEFDLVKEIEGLLQPIVGELRAATETPREIERLRGALEYANEHRVLAKEANENLEELIALAREAESLRPELLEALERSRTGWQERLRELDNQRTVAEFQLEQRLSQQESVLDSAQSVLGNFFRTRGLHLLMAAGAFFATLLLLRAAYRGVSRLLRKRATGERKFYARLIDVLYFGFSGLAALGGALLVLYSAGDWAVLGLAILLLLGLAWASKTAIPIFFDQIRLLLNLGTVREGERVVYDGLPWRVSRLSIGVLLLNSELQGGRLRVPLRDMTSLRSRPSASGEPWFPTSKGDWLLLEDERLAHVVLQSPEVVRLQLLGGSLVSYPTTDFLTVTFEQLSHGFRISQRFGIDYGHQAICTDEVPRVMHERLLAGLRERVDQQSLRGLKVEFLEAAASSLDYAVLADFEGEVAPRYGELKRVLQRLLVDICNDEGWVIPFTQVTVHSAPAS